MRQLGLLLAVALLTASSAEARPLKLTHGQARYTIREFAAEQARHLDDYWLKIESCHRQSRKVILCRVHEKVATVDENANIDLLGGTSRYVIHVTRRRSQVVLYDHALVDNPRIW